MRIVYLHQYFNTPKMPGSTRSFELGRRLAMWGHEVHVVTSWREPTRETDWFVTNEEQVCVHWLPVTYSNSMGYGERVRVFLKFALKSARRAASLPGDVVFASSTPLTIALPGVYAARSRKRPLVFEVRDLWPEIPIAMGALRNPATKWLGRRLERFAYDNSVRIVALSPGMAKGIEAMGYPSEKIAIIPNMADLEAFAPDVARERTFRLTRPELGEGKLILYPGTFGKINGVAYAVDIAAAWQRQRDETCRIVVIGRGAEWDLVERKAQSAGVLGHNFFMYPAIPKEEMVGAFSAASVILSLCIDLPELEANSANKFFDGLASGTPVAVNYGGWQAELLEATGAGLKLARDADVAAEQLRVFVDDENRLGWSAAQARHLAESRFSSDLLARTLESVLRDAASGVDRTLL